jgi:hypothetical protein
MSRKNVLIAAAVVLVGAAVVAANLLFQEGQGLTVTTDCVKTRDLEAIVSASGKIQPKRLVNISAETAGPGRRPSPSTKGTHQEGAVSCCRSTEVRSAAVSRATAASLGDGEGSLSQLRQGVGDGARAQGRTGASRTSPVSATLRAQQLTTAGRRSRRRRTTCARRSRRLQEREKQVVAQGRPHLAGTAPLESSRYDLTKVRMESPIRRIVTRRNIQQGKRRSSAR